MLQNKEVKRSSTAATAEQRNNKKVLAISVDTAFAPSQLDGKRKELARKELASTCSC